MNLRDAIYEEIRNVIDPELGINVVDLGLIYDVVIEEEQYVNITMTLTTPGCPLHDSISNGVKHAVESVEGIKEAHVNVVWSPPWSPERMSPAAIEQLQNR